jgi:class 3 adenylate cyclase/tetratricopeptide (TPR) repeat protein
VITCATCGHESPSKFRFCPVCGTALAGTPGPTEARKIVTVVFSDLTGSTAVGEHLDSETVRTIMARYFGVLRLALERHGGTVEKFIGDAVMAVFGIPYAREDDALRAVRAAAEMRTAVAGLNEELEREFGITIGNRTGVNTGEVVTGDPGAAGALVTGDTVNTAARLEQAAPPNGILLGGLTFELVRDAVTAEPVTPIVAKGKAEPVPAYRLEAVRGHAPGRARHLDAPIVGREAELTSLRRALDDCVSTPACRVAVVVGEAGVGKSRLVQAFLDSLDIGTKVLRGRCLSYGQGITYWPIAEALRQGLGIGEDNTPDDARARIEVVAADAPDAEVLVHHVSTVLGLSTTVVAPEDANWAIRRLLAALATGPLVLVLDDIHWAEPVMLELIERLEEGITDVPLLNICMTRPELSERWSPGSAALTLRLDPLGDDAALSLIDRLMGRASVTAQVRERIATAAQGNPLFIEELISMLMEGGLLRREGERWVPSTDLAALSIPPSIGALLGARLDQLSREERGVLQPASVIGQVFYHGAVDELALASPQDLDTGFSGLASKELIRRESGGLMNEKAYRFRHILIRDAAYEAVPKAHRATLHEGFADWLERRTSTRKIEFEEIIGYHLEQAYRYRLELRPEMQEERRLAERAAGLLAKAGGRAFVRADMTAASGLLARASDLLQNRDRGRAAMLPDLATALTALGRYDEAMTVVADATDMARELSDRVLSAHAELARLEIVRQIESGWVPGAKEHVEQIVQMLEEAEDAGGVARALGILAMLEMYDSCEGAGRALLRAAENARRAGDRRQETLYLSQAGTPWILGPGPVAEGIERCEQLLESVRGVRSAEGNALANLGMLRAMLGEFDLGRKLVAEGCKMLADLGRMVDAIGLRGQWMGAIDILAGDAAAAEREFREAVEFFGRTGDLYFLTSQEAELARALWTQGRLEEAEQFSRSSEFHAGPEDLQAQAQWRQTRALVLASAGKRGEAEHLAREAIDVLADTDFTWPQSIAHETLGIVLELGEDLEGAIEAFRHALDAWETKGNLVSAEMLRKRIRGLTSP